jgi:hypothetical protein
LPSFDDAIREGAQPQVNCRGQLSQLRGHPRIGRAHKQLNDSGSFGFSAIGNKWSISATGLMDLLIPAVTPGLKAAIRRPNSEKENIRFEVIGLTRARLGAG